MSKKLQKGHTISVVKKGSERPNPLLDKIFEKKRETLTTKQSFPLKLECNQKSKLISASEFKNHQKVENFANSDFFKLLVNTYLDDPECSKHFLIKNKSRIAIFESQNETILSYTPKSEVAEEIIIKAIQCAQMLMPFTAKSILCHQSYPNCAIELIVNGTSHYEALLHLIDKDNTNLPNAYNINKSVIEFLCTKLHDLSSSKNLYRIALTGEALSFTLDDTNEEHQINEINTSAECKTVFGQQFYNQNRLILLVSKQAEDLPNKPKLEWMISTLNKDEESIQIASSLVKGIRAKHNHDIYLIKESKQFTYKISEDYQDKLQIDTNWNLNTVFQYLYEKYTSGLISEIPITELKFVKNSEISSKRDEYYRTKAEINEIYQSLEEKFDKNEVKKKKVKQSQLKLDLNNMKKVSNKNPEKKKLMDELHEINQYLHSYDIQNYKIKKLNEKKSQLDEYIPNIKQFEEDIKSSKFKGRLFNSFGGYCFSSTNPISFDQEKNVQSSLLALARNNQIDADCIEKIITATVYISHHKTSLLSPDDFQQIIVDVCKKFSFIVSHWSKYKKQENNSASLTGLKGRICIEVLYPNFARIVVSEIKKALLGEQIHKFRIPKNIASKKMLLSEQNQEIIKNWLKNYHFDSIKFNGENWIGSKEEVRQAYELLKNEESCIHFSQKVIPIPRIIRKSEIWKLIENHNQEIDCEKWDLDDLSNCLIVGNEDVKEASELINLLESKKKTKNDDDALLGCINICEKEIPSELQLTVYNRDGSYNKNFLCSQCIMGTLDHNVSCFFENKIGIDFEALMSSMQQIELICITSDELVKTGSSDNDDDDDDFEYWPKVPIGQLLWNLVNDRNFADKAKVWVTEMLYKCLHLNRRYVTFCPDHPYIILKRPNNSVNLKCSINECPNILCSKCNEWHSSDKECSEWIGMKCPRCKAATEKKGGCNLMECKCGAIWCYKCGEIFNRSDDCKKHMIQEHGGTFD